MDQTPQTPPESSSDGTNAVVVKFIAAVISGPKVSAALAHYGILQVDPIVAGTLIAGLLHKAHLLIKKKTGWGWI